MDRNQLREQYDENTLRRDSYARLIASMVAQDQPVPREWIKAFLDADRLSAEAAQELWPSSVSRQDRV